MLQYGCGKARVSIDTFNDYEYENLHAILVYESLLYFPNPQYIKMTFLFLRRSASIFDDTIVAHRS